MIEQAIFTSARTAHGNGYHLVAKSPGISSEIAAELAIWGPSHGSLCVEHEDAASINYHRLAGGAFCVSKTVASGEEYSQRGGARIYTHFLILDEEDYARFAYQPFAVLRAAWAKGLLDVPERLPTALDAFSLAGRTVLVDEGLLAQLADEFGPRRTAKLLAAALEPGTKLIAGLDQPELAFAGLLNCLPAKCRGEVSFSTGLRYSPRRPFRLGLLESSADERRRVSRQGGVSVVDLETDDLQSIDSDGWPGLVADMMASDRLPELAGELQSPETREVANYDQLRQLAVRLRQNAKVVQQCANAASSQPLSADDADRQSRLSRSKGQPKDSSPTRDRARTRGGNLQAPRRDAARLAATTMIDLGNNTQPEAVELVEQLDDAVYCIINGQFEHRAVAEGLWHQLSETLPESTVSKLREQYLRYTLNLWESCLDDNMRNPDKAAGALEVLSVLFDHK